MEPLTEQEIQRYADEYNLPDLPPGPAPDPAVLARCMQVARDAFAATMRRPETGAVRVGTVVALVCLPGLFLLLLAIYHLTTR
jgi:hypothetical protein